MGHSHVPHNSVSLIISYDYEGAERFLSSSDIVALIMSHHNMPLMCHSGAGVQCAQSLLCAVMS